MPAPAFSVVRRFEQPIDKLLVGIRGFVAQESLNLCGRRGQAEKVERCAAKQCEAVGVLGET